MARGCLGYVVADRETRQAAIVDPELEMVEPMLDFVFEHGLKPFYVVDTHTHADHFSAARELKAKTVARSDARGGAVERCGPSGGGRGPVVAGRRSTAEVPAHAGAREGPGLGVAAGRMSSPPTRCS